MAKHKQYKIGPITGSHPTSIRAARESAENKAAKELEADYTPYYREAFGATLVVWREPCLGWTYQIRHPERNDHRADMRGVVSADWCRSDAIAGALEHMADLYWDRAESSIPEDFDMGAIVEIWGRDKLRLTMPFAPYVNA